MIVNEKFPSLTSARCFRAYLLLSEGKHNYRRRLYWTGWLHGAMDGRRTGKLFTVLDPAGYISCHHPAIPRGGLVATILRAISVAIKGVWVQGISHRRA